MAEESFVGGILRGMQNKGRPSMVFDWNKAAQIIAKRKPAIVSAGLAGDWDFTGGDIFKDGKPIPKDETYVYLASTWATPSIEIDGHRTPCFVMADKTDGWDSGTYWPESALQILKEAA